MFKWPWIEESLARINDRKAEKAEQDEPVYNMCAWAHLTLQHTG